MGRKVFLSVDFDYFCRELPEWDWGHAETSVYREIAWVTRVGVYEETRLDKFANPHPKDFWTKLQEAGFTFDNCETFTVADSHLWAAPDFIDLAPFHGTDPIAIVNFDAHHDMGYKPWAELKRQWLDKGRVDCSNWLLGLLYKYRQLTASVVYPEWKGTSEVGEGGKPWDRPLFRKRFDYGVYSERLLQKLAGDVVGIFVAKSSAWMPPWHDKAFADFVLEGSGETGLDAQVPFESEEGRNPLDPRDFDLEAYLAHDKQLRKMMVDMIAERKAAAGK